MDRKVALRRIEQTLKHAYDEDAFRLFVRELFAGKAQERSDSHISGQYIFGKLRGDKYETFREKIASYKRIAKYTDPDGDVVDVLAVKLRQQITLERARTMQRDFVARYLTDRERSAALVAFYTDETSQWRFSLVRLEYRQEIDDTGKVKVSEELTPAKRYSFRVGEDEPLRTAKEQLLKLLLPNEPPSLEEVDAAFSVEPVTREFFKDYDRTFKEAERQIQGFGLEEEGLDSGEKEKRQEARWLFAQRLFNRLLFIRFLEKKGWLQLGDGQQDRAYLHALWKDYEQNEGQTEDGNFCDDRLRVLFFQGLNEEQEHSRSLIGQVPYLNGELFEPDADDRRDGLHIPDDALRPIFEGPRDDDEGLFYRYNFTVAESTPLDVEVAVDPEMLGKVFEKLVTGRSKTGSYYTPKTVVAFMCREALKGYLGGYAGLVDRHDPVGIEVEEARALINKLAEIKVVDPACGSGAYLLGMLHELHELYRILDTRAGEATPRDDYDRKLDVIRDNLYGVDIDRFAVNIAQLRLWLSLIIEYEGDTPEPLPNLHFSIGCGDSLAAPSPTSNGSLFRSAAFPKIRRVERLQRLHQRARGERKHKLEEAEHEAEQELTELLEDDPAPEGAFDWRVRFAGVFTDTPADSTLGGELNMGQELAPPPREGGFDVVLANPPYGARVDAGTRDLFFDRKDGAQSKDTYGLFLARGLQLLCPDGQLCYIVSDTWRTIQSHRPLRRRLLNTTTVAHTLDLPSWIFDAVVNTNILTLQKQPPPNDHTLIAGDLRGIERGDWRTLEKNLRAVARHSVDVQTLSYARYTYPQRLIGSYDNLSFFIGAPELHRLVSDATPPKLGELSEVRQGLSTADNYYYIRHQQGVGRYEPLNESLLLSDKEFSNLSAREKEKGIDPAQYGGRHFIPYDKGGPSETAEGWLPNYHVPTDFYIDWSESAVERLKNATVKDTKTRRGQKSKIKPGDDSKRAAVFRNSDFYFSEGLTFSDSGVYAPTFRLSAGSVFDQKGSIIIPKADAEASPKYLLGLLCSKLARYTYKVYINHSVSVHVDSIKEFRIRFEREKEGEIIALVNQIIEKQKENPRYPYHEHEQKKIDRLVYDLYGLNADDIREIELWYARRYPRLAEGQGLLDEIEDKYAAHLKRAERVMSKPPEYWASHPVLELVAEGESQTLEFKEAFQTNLHTGQPSSGAKKKTLKTIAAFLNSDAGGTLLIGVSDSGEVKGLALDFQHIDDEDDFELRLRQAVNDTFEPAPIETFDVTFEDLPEGKRVCQVKVAPAPSIVHYDGDIYVRDGNHSPRLTGGSARAGCRRKPAAPSQFRGSKFTSTDRRVDDLYGLTEEEIAIVEASGEA